MSGKTRIKVEVVHALRGEQILISLEVEEGTTAGQAVERSGLLKRIAGIELTRGRVGIFGKVVALERPLRDGDRVEIYRSLLADPKDARRMRATRRRSNSRR